MMAIAQRCAATSLRAAVGVGRRYSACAGAGAGHVAAGLHRPQSPEIIQRSQFSTETSVPLWQRSSVSDALAASCYLKIDFKISEDAMVYEAVQRFAAYKIGALAVTNSEGQVNGIISERDYVCKIALLGRNSKSTKVKEIATMGTNIVVAKASDSVSDCMKKMLSRDIRHLPVVDDSGDVVGLMSIKDLVREVAREKDDLIHKIADFKLGRGGYFEHT